MAPLPRSLSETIRRAARTFPAILVTGPRQSGKTTLCRELLALGGSYVSLEDPDVRQRARSDPNGFLDQLASPVVIDEIQQVPDLLSYLKTRIDARREPGRFFMTGSQSLALMQGVSQSLAGRVAVLTLLPLAIDEARGAILADEPNELLGRLFASAPPSRPLRPTAPTMGDWLLRGAFPEPRANPAVDLGIWCASYVQTYLERDVRALLRVGDLSDFERFVRLCAARTGQLLNLSDLARDTGISVPTAKHWLSTLEASFVVFRLLPYHQSFGKRLVKAPKLYFVDTALAAYLTGLRDHQALLQGPMAGALLETAVVTAWRKRFFNSGELPAMYFWRSSDGVEVDLIVERNGRLYPMEIKLTATVKPEHGRALVKWRELEAGTGKPTSPGGVILANVAEPQVVCKGVRALPWWWV